MCFLCLQLIINQRVSANPVKNHFCLTQHELKSLNYGGCHFLFLPNMHRHTCLLGEFDFESLKFRSSRPSIGVSLVWRGWLAGPLFVFIIQLQHTCEISVNFNNFLNCKTLDIHISQTARTPFEFITTCTWTRMKILRLPYPPDKI